MNIYPFIEAEKAQQHSVARACRLLQVSRAACTAYRAGPSARHRADEVLTTRIKAVHAESKGRYGAPRVHADLARRGHRHGRKRVARLMQAAGLGSFRKRLASRPPATGRRALPACRAAAPPQRSTGR